MEVQYNRRMPRRGMISGQKISPRKLKRAREMRGDPTEAEEILWQALRRSRAGRSLQAATADLGLHRGFLLPRGGPRHRDRRRSAQHAGAAGRAGPRSTGSPRSVCKIPQRTGAGTPGVQGQSGSPYRPLRATSPICAMEQGRRKWGRKCEPLRQILGLLRRDAKRAPEPGPRIRAPAPPPSAATPTLHSPTSDSHTSAAAECSPACPSPRSARRAAAR